MITKIQPALYKNTNRQAFFQKSENKHETTDLINSYNLANPALLKNYFISFTGTQNNYGRPKFYDDLYNNTADMIENKAIALAKSYNHKEVNHYHFISIAISETLDYINELNKGVSSQLSNNGNGPEYFLSVFKKEDLYEKKSFRDKFEKLLKEEKDYIDKKLEAMPKKSDNTQQIKISKAFYNDMSKSRESLERTDYMVNGYDIYNGAFLSEIKEIDDFNEDFQTKVLDILMLENEEKPRLHFSKYDKKAETILKNLKFNTNVMVLYDKDKTDPNSFVPSIRKTIGNSSEIIEFNKDVTYSYFISKLDAIKKQKDKTFVVLFSQNNLVENSTNVNDYGQNVFVMTSDYLNYLASSPDNIKIIAFESQDKYLSHLTNPIIAKYFNQMCEISVPVLDSNDMMHALKDNKYKLSKNALAKVVNFSSTQDGIYPNKTINLLNKISSFYIDKNEITLNDVETYLKEADYLYKQSSDDDSINILFDTKKRLKDIIGKNNTKKEAENIIRQIKKNKIGTKGYIIYNQDGMAGGGRRHTAEVIAGEAHVPFVAINTMDFGTKDVNLFGENMSGDASMKKLFSQIAAQAESNPHKSVVLYIENFEYFSVGEMISEYHQKAMAQLIREMENAEKKGLNIVVIGSVTNPQMIGEATMKSFKFTDSIEVSSPAFSEIERYDILKNITKKNHIKLSGSVEEQNKMLKDMSKTLEGFSFIELKAFIKKAESVALERNHKEITKNDLIESYLRLVSGRPFYDKINEHEKEITTKHECGHALTATIMNELMKKSGKPWHLPDKVNFITLDPRGSYGGAMYSKGDNNKDVSFENIFSDIVCAYGGHSAEKYFFDMDGSWGITGDLNSATKRAEVMVKNMGQGFNTGKLSLANSDIKNNPELNQKIYKDVNVITKNALTVSDAIVEAYADFINKFSDKYSQFVGTGECLIDGDVFREELENWKSEQDSTKLNELETLDNIILDIINATKKGKIY